MAIFIDAKGQTREQFVHTVAQEGQTIDKHVTDLSALTYILGDSAATPSVAQWGCHQLNGCALNVVRDLSGACLMI